MPFKRLLFAILIASCLTATAQEEAASPESPPPVPITPGTLPELSLTPQILYQLLLAEVAAGRGQWPLAAQAYADLAKTTRDPRIARRAAEVAYYARQLPLALQSVRVWMQVDPASVQAKQTYWALLAAAGRSSDLAEDLGRVVAAGPQRPGVLLLQLGQLLARFENKKMVDSVVQQVTQPYDNLPEAHFVRAQSAYFVEDSDRARHELDRALQLKPDWELAAVMKAQLMEADPLQAVDYLAQFVAANPKAGDARLAYARALLEVKRYAEAQKIFTALHAEQPDRPDLIYALGLLALQSGDTANAEKYLKSLADKDFAEADSTRFYLGQIAEDSGRQQEALDDYDAVAATSQRYTQAQTLAAALLARMGQLPAARERLHAIAAANPKQRIELLVMEAQLLGDAGQNDAAFQLLDAALAENKDDPNLLYESAMFAERIGKTDVLEHNLRKVIQLKPDYAHAYNALGYSFADRNQNLDEANALIDKALALAPDDPFILDSKGWVDFRRGDMNAAVDNLHKALTLRPDPEIAAHLGEVLWRLGREKEAIKTWDEARKTAPDNAALAATIKRFQP